MLALAGLLLMVLLAGIAAVVVVGVVIALMYNGLVVLRNRCENAWSQIDVQLKRRFDLIPNLIETVKGYAAHEKDTFQKITEARAAMANAKGVKDAAEANNMLTGALKTLFAVAENYPQLKANENFKALQEELATTENKIAYARQFYNDSVMQYDTKRETFPSTLIANMFGFKDREYFEVEEEAKKAVKVDFTSKK